MRYFIEIAYKGANYHGWQVQQNAVSVQEVLQKSIAQLWPEITEVVGSGRTDTGVHALQQFAHFEGSEAILNQETLYRLNGLLPHDIAVKALYQMKEAAHARFDAVARSYQYRIHRIKDPFVKGLSYYYSRELNLSLMNKAAALLLEHQNYQCFSKVKTQVNNYSCAISQAEWKLENDQLTFYVSANRFLRGMVRAMVGTLLEVGLERCSLEEFENILATDDRTKAGPSVAPEGLFLSRVEYPTEIFINSITWNKRRLPVK